MLCNPALQVDIIILGDLVIFLNSIFTISSHHTFLSSGLFLISPCYCYWVIETMRLKRLVFFVDQPLNFLIAQLPGTQCALVAWLWSS